jgi:polysaccharide biosynthesis protein PslE
MLMVLFRKRRTFLCVAGLVFAAFLWYVIAGTKYQANMKILVRRGRTEAPVSAGVNAPLDLTRVGITEEELNSEVELLRDHDVLRKVVEQNGSRGRDWFHILHLREGRAQRVERATRRLAEQLRVQPVKKTNLIAISYRAGDAESAAKLLRCLAAAYMEKHTAVHRPAGELKFFEKQTEESRRQVEESSRRLLLFTKNQGIVAAAQQRDMAIQKLGELEAGQRQTRIEMAETRQRIVELEELLAKLPERTITQVRTSENAELLRSLKASLLDLQLRRTQLLTKFEPNHRLVQEVDQQIGEAEAAVAVESASPLRDETSDKNVNYEWASSGLQSAQVQWKALQARRAATLEQAAAWRSIAGRLGEDAITQDDLVSARNAAQENYLLYVKKREEARMNDALDERGIVNVAIVEEPVAPALPVFSVWTIVAMGLAGAVLAGGAAAFAADYLDPLFRDPDDVVNCLNLAVLASLPTSGNSKLAA